MQLQLPYFYTAIISHYHYTENETLIAYIKYDHFESTYSEKIIPVHSFRRRYTTVIPEVSSFNILDNNIFHNA